MKFSVAVSLFFALVAIARGSHFLRALEEEDLPDPVTLQIVLEFTPSKLVTGVNGTDPVTVPRIIDDVDVVVTRERRAIEDDGMFPVRRPLGDIGVPTTMNVILSELPPTPPIYTTPPVTDTPPTTTPEGPTETTEPPVMTPYDRSDRAHLILAA